MSFENVVKASMPRVQESRQERPVRTERVKRAKRHALDYATQAELTGLMLARGYSDDEIRSSLTGR